jgi:hypothetical protein
MKLQKSGKFNAKNSLSAKQSKRIFVIFAFFAVKKS